MLLYVHIILFFMAIICGLKKILKQRDLKSKVIASGRQKHKPRSPNYFPLQSQYSIEDAFLF